MVRSSKAGETRKLADFVCREEWDFNSNITEYTGCPDAELEECLFYECARRTVLWPAIFDYVKADGGNKAATAGDNLWLRLYEFLALFEEFPTLPWLKIERSKRQNLLKIFSHRGTYRPPITEVDHFEAEIPNLSSVNDLEDKGRGPFWPDGSEILSHYKAVNPLFADTFHTFRICWENSTRELAAAFAKWLMAHRPDESKDFSSAGKRNTRNDVLRSSLDGIGAWTLTHNDDVSQQFSMGGLIAATKAVAKDGSKNPRPLYGSWKRWKGAEERAESNLRCVVPEEFCLSIGSQYDFDPARPTQSKLIWIRMKDGVAVFGKSPMTAGI